MDPLSEVLRSVRLTGGVFLSVRFTAPWCITVAITPDDCARNCQAQLAQDCQDHRPARALSRLESEEAFSRAFKREYGVSPGQWRERALH